MPNPRRRKFSVQNDIARKNLTKGGASTTNSNLSSNSAQKTNKNLNKIIPNRSMLIEPMAVVLECDERSYCSYTSLAKQESKCNPDLSTTSPCSPCPFTPTISVASTQPTSHLSPRPSKRETMDSKRHSPQRQQRARIRSPKQSVLVCESPSIEIYNSANSSLIKLHGLSTSVDSASLESQFTTSLSPRSSKRETEDRTLRKKSHQHRARVRSPKHSLLALETPSVEIYKVDDIGTCVDVGIESCMETVGTSVIDWAQEFRVYTTNAAEVAVLELEQHSDHSLDDMCRICHSGDCLSPELGSLVSACNCRGTVGRVHVRCLERWLTESGKSRCELCGTRYHTHRVHRYGVLKALIMWFLSQNAKQLMVDSLGIMLMSPLAVLAAWLSGRTLASLMTQESQVTPWPLASTFVLACMTLVCYYCWIVSAATRHALGWWIWYRSQYEVRLELQDEVEES